MLVVAFKVVLPFPLACLQAPERCRNVFSCIAVHANVVQKCTRVSAQAFLSGIVQLWLLDTPEQGKDNCHQGAIAC